MLTAPMPIELHWNFDNSYTRLPAVLFDPSEAARFPAPRLVIANEALVRELGLDLSRASAGELAAIFSGQTVPAGATPIAQAYASACTARAMQCQALAGTCRGPLHVGGPCGSCGPSRVRAPF